MHKNNKKEKEGVDGLKKELLEYYNRYKEIQGVWKGEKIGGVKK